MTKGSEILKSVRLTAVALLLMLLLPAAAGAQTFALKNNLAYDATTTPNLGFELKMAPRWTAQLNVGFNPFSFSDNRKLRHLLIMPQARYWLCEAFAGHYLSFNAAYVHYNVSDIHFPLGLFPAVKDERRQGDLAAIGASYGYNFILSPHWSLELEGGADIGYCWSKVYKCMHCGRYIGKDDKAVLLPRLAVNISYIW